MLKIMITDRKGIEKIALNPFYKTALISITDYEYPFAFLENKPQYLLRLSFDDVPVGDGFEEEYGHKLNPKQIDFLEKKFHSMSEEQAQSIVAFYNEVCKNVETIICQCEHGQSRSAALAAAFSEYTYGNGIEVFSDDRYFPNKSIYRTIFRKLNL